MLLIALLRRTSPSADMRALRDEVARNPLTVLPPSRLGTTAAPLTPLNADLASNYGLKITFGDGHATGVSTWAYLREIAAQAPGQ